VNSAQHPGAYVHCGSAACGGTLGASQPEELQAMRKLTLEEIQRNAARFGGRCLSETYIDSLTLMEWECAAGHRWRAVPHAIRQGHWCKRCADARLRHSADLVHALAAARGGKCLAQRYVNSQAKLEWQCAQGHRWHSSLNSVKQGSWCRQCRLESRPTRQAKGSASAQSAAMKPKPEAPSVEYSEPETTVMAAAAPPMPVP
jgi:hypothetical protein